MGGSRQEQKEQQEGTLEVANHNFNQECVVSSSKGMEVTSNRSQSSQLLYPQLPKAHVLQKLEYH